MATKRASSTSKKGGSKKSASKKSAAKKGSAKKGAAKKGRAIRAGSEIPPPNINFYCLQQCYQRYLNCLKKGVGADLCWKRYQRCIMNCLHPGAAPDVDPSEG